MCGIYGIASSAGVSQDLKAPFSKLGSALSHRGPDGKVEVCEQHHFTGFTRLAIVDIANGMQPFFSEDRNIMVTANGEIYNFQELREELISQGHILKSSCDIEVIPHLYEIYGDSFVKKLRGMFAIALIDYKSCQLKLYVDSLGEKPLYWSRNANYLVYSSELVPLLNSNLVDMVLDPTQIPSYIKYGFTLDPFTVVQDIYRVSGGTYLTFSLGDSSVSQTKHWNYLHPQGKRGESVLINPVSTFEQELMKISENIAQGEVKFGVALSGGVDSSAVAKLVQPHIDNLESITIGYQEKSRHDESNLATKSAQIIGIANSLKKVGSEDAAKRLAHVCSVIDEPIADISSINYLLIFQFAKDKGIKVLLTGHGADEIFLGYDWIFEAVARAKVRAHTLAGDFNIKGYWQCLINPFLSRSIFTFVHTLQTNIGVFRQVFRDLIDYRNDIDVIDFYNLSSTHYGTSKFADKLFRELKTESFFYRTFSSKNYEDFLDYARYQLVSDYLRVNGFLQIDKISMSQSVESRNPLSDLKLAEISVFSNWDASRVPRKALLLTAIQTLRNIKPVSQKKQGFSPPVRLWYKAINRCYREQLDSPRVIEIGLVPPGWLKYFKRPFTWYGLKSPVWFHLVFLELWVRQTERQVGKKFVASNTLKRK
jgi:asparagine synthase (glutamine-hydrolysing)